MSKVNLGVPADEKYEHGDNANSGPLMPRMDDNDKVVYPHFHYCGPLDLELPDSGELLVRFVKRKETSFVEEDGSHWYECKVEIREILKVDGKEPEAHLPAKSYDAASDALDAIAKKISADHEAGEEDEGGNDSPGQY